MWLLAEGNAAYFFLLALVVATGVILWRTQRRMNSGGGQSASTPPARPTGKPPRGTDPRAPQDMVQWQVQLHEFARDTSARIDSKMAALQHLMRAAHHEAIRLEEAIETARQLGVAELKIESPADQAAESPQPIILDNTPSNRDQPPSDQDRQLGGPNTNGNSNHSAAERPVAAIYALHDAGQDILAIARRLSIPAGEVQLILSLRQDSGGSESL